MPSTGAAAMTIRLSRPALDRARQFVAAKGRLLDAVLLKLALGEGSGTVVLAALSPYQNEDGGFGHGLEPDLRTPASTAIVTSVGLQILRRARAPSDHPMVEGAIGYLLQTLDHAQGVWPIVGPAVDEAPHAPWWSHGPDLAAAWNGFRFNPTAELLGVLIEHKTLVPPDLLAGLEAKMLAAIGATSRLDGAYDLMAAWRLAETPGLGAPLSTALAKLLEASLVAIAPDDPHVNYLELAPPAPGPLATLVAPRFAQAADAAIADQQPDGNWMPFWTWSETSAAGWFAAEADWNSLLTRRTIEVLAAHDQIDPA
jgi:hypothetical protein